MWMLTQKYVKFIDTKYVYFFTQIVIFAHKKKKKKNATQLRCIFFYIKTQSDFFFSKNNVHRHSRQYFFLQITEYNK